jgi:hypothetical protein
MGKFLGTDYIDTVEIFLIETATAEADFRFVDYAKFIRQQKEDYGNQKQLPRHNTMHDYLVQDFADFMNWIITRHQHLLNDTHECPMKIGSRSKPGNDNSEPRSRTVATI